MRSGTAFTAAAVLALATGSTWADNGAKVCDSPKEVQGFKTCADVAKAEAEGEIVLYTTDPEHGTVQMLAAFNKAFPKIKTNYIRLQAGALYQKLLSERQAKSFLVDVMQISDMGMVLDFQKRGGYRQWISPEHAAYKPEYQSQPPGYFTWGAIIMSGLAYNSSLTPKEQAPKTWEDAIDPKWAEQVNVKVSNSGLQHTTWYELRRVLGPDYFKKMAEVKPRAFDSYVQQYQRVVNGEDKIVHSAQYSGYLEFKAKGAPVEFVYPATGLPASPESWGLIADGPHPNAGALFMDWFLSPLGQKANADALFLNSARDDVAPPPGGVSVKELKLLFPADWQDYLKSRTEFAKEWDRIVGLRK